MDDEQGATSVGNRVHESVEPGNGGHVPFLVSNAIENAEPALHGDRDIDFPSHRGNASSNPLRVRHEGGAEGARRHAIRRAAAVQVDLVETGRGAVYGRGGEGIGLGTTELQRDRMFACVVGEKALPVTVYQRLRRYHFGIQHQFVGNEAKEGTEVSVSPVHHRRHTQPMSVAESEGTASVVVHDSSAIQPPPHRR